MARNAATRLPPAAPPHPVLQDYYGDEDDHRRFVADLFDRAAPHYDWVNSVMSCGGGRRYRRRALLRVGLGPGMHVLDVAAGTGLLALAAKKIVGQRGLVAGLDASAGMLRELRSRTSLPATRAVAERLPFTGGAFDLVTMGYALRHVADLRVAFAEFLRVLRPGGTLLVLELSRPRSRLGAAVLRTYLKCVVPWITRLGTGSTDAQRMMEYCWDTIESCVDPETVLGVMVDCGFRDTTRKVKLGVCSEFSGTRG